MRYLAVRNKKEKGSRMTPGFLTWDQIVVPSSARSGFRFSFLFSFSFLRVREKVHEFGFVLVELEMSSKLSVELSG